MGYDEDVLVYKFNSYVNTVLAFCGSIRVVVF